MPQRLAAETAEVVLLSPEQLGLLPTEAEAEIIAPATMENTGNPNRGYYPISGYVRCSADSGLVFRTSGARLKGNVTDYLARLVPVLGRTHILRTRPLPEEMVYAHWRDEQDDTSDTREE